MNDSLKIISIKIGNKDFLQFDFEGDLKDPIALDCIKQWKDEMRKLSPGQKINLIFNCCKMSGFETEARKHWQETMKLFKGQINDVWIVSENIFIRTAAKTMGLLTGFNMKTCNSVSEVS
ncbi:MAG: hypothetical protein JST69_10505 [Bacteroidetes bacterium]|nr:hypothetical protein [Bacteroidota bacterium]